MNKTPYTKLPFLFIAALASVGSSGVRFNVDFVLEWLLMLLLLPLPLPLLENISLSSSIVFLTLPFGRVPELGSDVEIKQAFELAGLLFVRSWWYL